ncbi:amino acid adenylation domain-containing protein [Micromonospora sp. KLBMP9576]|uniref:amino acid adenylation domain-containing protein n=1 Tax=Micromonospora sp. KLBMP9576 TaxID=3424769 RepID=UPI003D92E20F
MTGGRLADHLARRLDTDRDAPAVTGETTLTYGELAEHVDTVATSVAPFVSPGDVVALEVRSPALGLIAALAADRLGVAYLPLDVSAPPPRRQWVLESSAATALLRETGPLRLAAQPLGAGRPVVALTDPGYVIYTSGTTGRPKGVHVPKRSLVERLAGLLAVPGFPPGGSLLAMSALSFDMSIVETLLPLVAGGSMVTLDLAARRDAEVFGRAVRRFRPGVVQATPSFFRLMLASGWAGGSDLTVWCGGEAMTPEVAAALHGCCREVWNLYGPTEACVWASAWRFEPGRPISLGTELPGTTVELVGAGGAVLTGVGAEGEIRISGAGIADGYLAAPPGEDDRFRSTPGTRSYLTGDRARRGPDGSLTFLGRNDNQVKVRGHRVELGEIESALECHPAVTEAIAVLVGRDDPETARLAAVVVSRRRVAARDLRRWLADRLPAPMIPQSIEIAPALPRTSTGKLDRVRVQQVLDAGRLPT